METLTTKSPVISRRKLSIDEYHLMAEAGIIRPDERVELIKGEILQMSPIGDKHLSIVSRIHTLLTPALIGKYIVHVQSPVKIPNHSEPEPDLMVVPYRDDFYADTGVLPKDVRLLIEVSDTTLQKDQLIKLPLYAEAGIVEVWIVDINAKKIYQYLRPQQDEYLERKTYDRSMKISASQLSLEVEVKALIG